MAGLSLEPYKQDVTGSSPVPPIFFVLIGYRVIPAIKSMWVVAG